MTSVVNYPMRIAEIYRSVQGEGLLTGAPSVFVRASGCNLRCWFCDTPYTSWRPEGRDMSVDEIVAQVEEWDTQHVVVTGGEPMLFAELIPLCERLRAIGRHVTIETAGTLYLPVECDLMSISPKFASSAPDADAAPALASAARARAASAGRDSPAGRRVRVPGEIRHRYARRLGRRAQLSRRSSRRSAASACC